MIAEGGGGSTIMSSCGYTVEDDDIGERREEEPRQMEHSHLLSYKYYQSKQETLVENKKRISNS